MANRFLRSISYCDTRLFYPLFYYYGVIYKESQTFSLLIYNTPAAFSQFSVGVSYTNNKKGKLLSYEIRKRSAHIFIYITENIKESVIMKMCALTASYCCFLIFPLSDVDLTLYNCTITHFCTKIENVFCFQENII